MRGSTRNLLCHPGNRPPQGRSRELVAARMRGAVANEAFSPGTARSAGHRAVLGSWHRRRQVRVGSNIVRRGPTGAKSLSCRDRQGAVYGRTSPPSHPRYFNDASAGCAEAKKPEMQGFLEPTRGLEPLTPSLPCRARDSHLRQSNPAYQAGLTRTGTCRGRPSDPPRYRPIPPVSAPISDLGATPTPHATVRVGTSRRNAAASSGERARQRMQRPTLGQPVAHAELE